MQTVCIIMYTKWAADRSSNGPQNGRIEHGWGCGCRIYVFVGFNEEERRGRGVWRRGNRNGYVTMKPVLQHRLLWFLWFGDNRAGLVRIHIADHFFISLPLWLWSTPPPLFPLFPRPGTIQSTTKSKYTWIAVFNIFSPTISTNYMVIVRVKRKRVPFAWHLYSICRRCTYDCPFYGQCISYIWGTC